MFIDVSTQTSELQAQIMIQGMLYVPSEALDNIPVCRWSTETGRGPKTETNTVSLATRSVPAIYT